MQNVAQSSLTLDALPKSSGDGLHRRCAVYEPFGLDSHVRCLSHWFGFRSSRSKRRLAEATVGRLLDFRHNISSKAHTLRKLSWHVTAADQTAFQDERGKVRGANTINHAVINISNKDCYWNGRET